VTEQIGWCAVWMGILLIVAGLIGGFTAMFREADSLAVNLLVLVPLGFVVLLTGTVILQLFVNRNAD